MPSTKATLGYVIETYLAEHDGDETTLDTYRGYYRRSIKPQLGNQATSQITAKVLEQFYGRLRKCSAICRGADMVDHQIARVPGSPTSAQARATFSEGRSLSTTAPRPGCVVVECKPRVCEPMRRSSVRQIRAIISGALDLALRWDWIEINPATVARSPSRRNHRHPTRRRGRPINLDLDTCKPHHPKYQELVANDDRTVGAYTSIDGHKWMEKAEATSGRHARRSHARTRTTAVRPRGTALPRDSQEDSRPGPATAGRDPSCCRPRGGRCRAPGRSLARRPGPPRTGSHDRRRTQPSGCSAGDRTPRAANDPDGVHGLRCRTANAPSNTR
ncbi:hypothetical protein F1D05_24330 [Kribbella qitaiheensis]|uniref:UDP-N-acetylglucosamine kinase n=1 Tax=Kribbella qitaiheensis TaxID=1544730 RepID=A0A7G6X2K1_9ACTN|nr:hypothetical protein F1D05_24330 [Kribbella qitaiheensis]